MTGERRYTVYRFYDDDVLLYVGVSGSALRRWQAHGGKSWFARATVCRLEHFSSALEAYNVEAVAIRDEGPLFNIAGGSRSPNSMSDDIPRLSPLPEIAAIWKSLTPSEQRVAVSIADGLSTQQIAARLGVGFETVKTHTSRILAKFDVRSRLQVAAKFMAEVA